MRVISGTARGRKLKRVPGETTRPIMDRVKENLFNLITAEFTHNCTWLDLFAGTGAVGVEALSRGADHVVFTDTAKVAITTIKDNLETVGFGDRATVRNMDAFTYLQETDTAFDVIYVAPPQYHGVWVGAMTGIDMRSAEILKPDGIAVVQIDPKEYQELTLTNLSVYKSKTYGNTQLLFYEQNN